MLTPWAVPWTQRWTLRTLSKIICIKHAQHWKTPKTSQGLSNRPKVILEVFRRWNKISQLLDIIFGRWPTMWRVHYNLCNSALYHLVEGPEHMNTMYKPRLWTDRQTKKPSVNFGMLLCAVSSPSPLARLQTNKHKQSLTAHIVIRISSPGLGYVLLHHRPIRGLGNHRTWWCIEQKSKSPQSFWIQPLKTLRSGVTLLLTLWKCIGKPRCSAAT